MALKKSQKSLKDWTDQDWSTKSGKKSSETGERYLPKSAIDSLSSQEYAATTKKKRDDSKKGKQHSKQPKKIAKKTAQYRNKGGLMSSSDDLVQEKNEGGLVSDTSPRMERAREAKEERQALGVPEDTTVQDAAYFAASLAPVTGEAIAAKEALESFEKGDYGMATLSAAGAIPLLGMPARVAAKALKAPKWFKASDSVPDNIPAPEKAQLTQINTKIYDKVDSYFSKNNTKGKTLDYGAGHGHGASILKADSYEPFPKDRFVGGKPTFSSSADIPSESYDKIVNTYVLNVVPKDVRDGLVSEMGRVLKPGGEAVIVTRGTDVFGSKARPVKAALGPEDGSVILAKGTYQKGFTPTELKEYTSDILGEGFTVDIVNTSGTSPGIRLTKAIEKHKGGLMYGNKQNKKMHGGGHAKKDYSKYKKMNMGGYTGGMTQAMGMNPMFDETEEMPQMNCGGYMGGGMMSADVIVGIDPVSGNEIPLGSDAENVRDDIPAMLSEDEYVLPADVVKWHGLKHIQEMHDEASMGLMSMAMDGLVATGEPAVKSKDAEKVKQEYRTEKGSRKTPEGVEVELTAYEVEDNADLEKEDDSKYKSKVKGNMKEYGKGGLLGYAEGGLVDDEDPDPYGDLLDDGFEFDADMMNAEMLEEVAAEQRARDKELEPYMREESLSEEDAADLFDVDEDAGVIDVPDGGMDTTPVSEDEEISEDKVNKVAAALLKQASSYSGSGSEGAAFMSGLGNGVKMAELGKKVGDQLADYETKSGNNPFGFLRDDKGFFRKRG